MKALIESRTPYRAPRKKEPWEEILVSPVVREVIRTEKCVREGLRIIREKCGISGIRHAFEVAEAAPRVVRAIRGSPQEERFFIFGSLLHDLGKAELEDDFSGKISGLSPAERALIEKHPKGSFEFLMAYGMADVAKIVVCHHERCKSYPRKGGERRKNESRWPFKERRNGRNRREDNPWHDEMGCYLSLVDIFASMKSGCYDSRPYIACKDPQENLVDRAAQLRLFSSPNEQSIIRILNKGGFKVLVSDAGRNYH